MLRHRFRTALVVLLLLVAPGVHAKGNATEAEIRAMLADRVDIGKQSVGLVVGVIDKDGRTVVGYGRMGPENDATPDGKSVFEIGSISKVFTGTLLADMVKRGELSLEAPVQKYLADDCHPQVAEGAKPITLYDLATHTSGLPRMPDNFAPADPTNPYVDYTVEQLCEFVSGHEPTRAPGEQAEYSNLAMGLLGHILAEQAGGDYETLVRKRIAGPLKMKDTVITFTPELEKRLAHGHDASLRPAANWDLPSNIAGAGALRSTVDDMLTFAAANLGLVESKLAGALEFAREPREDFQGEEFDVGLAWITRNKHDRKIVWHNGGTGGYHSFIGLDLERGRGVVILSNATPSIDDIGFHLLEPKYELAEVQPPERLDALPDSPAGKALNRWLEAVVADDVEVVKAHYEDAFHEGFRNAVPIDAYLGFREQLAGPLKEATIEKVDTRSDHDLTAYGKTSDGWLAFIIQVLPEEPFPIIGLRVQPSEPPE